MSAKEQTSSEMLLEIIARQAEMQEQIEAQSELIGELKQMLSDTLDLFDWEEDAE